MMSSTLKELFLAGEIRGKGIKCDHCTFNIDYVEFTEANVAHFLNRPCPECGFNLLTIEGVKTLRKAQRVMKVLNVIMFPVMIILLPTNLYRLFKGKPIRTRAHASMNGSGSLKFEV